MPRTITLYTAAIALIRKPQRRIEGNGRQQLLNINAKT